MAVATLVLHIEQGASMTPAEQFIIWRRRQGISQTMAGHWLGTNRGMIRRIERGEVHPCRFLEPTMLPNLLSPGEELWLMRRRHGLTKEQAAAVLDCSRTQLYLLEHGRVSIRGRDLVDIESAYRLAL
jgi:DNA-binding XRE family transcriptional regulator